MPQAGAGYGRCPRARPENENHADCLALAFQQRKSHIIAGLALVVQRQLPRASDSRRQADLHAQAMWLGGQHAGVTTVAAGDFCDDRQTEAAAAGHFAGTPEALEHMGQLLR